MALDRNEILLGAGQFYGVAYSDAIPVDEDFEVDDNDFGRTSGGATLTYKPKEYEVVDDANEVVKRFITSEEVSIKVGVLTWNLDNLSKLSPATTEIVGDEKILSLGGASELPSYAVRFVHEKADGKKLRVTLIGTAGSGFDLKFVGDKETVVDAEFKALSQDDGTLVELREEIESEDIVSPTISSVTPADNAASVPADSAVVWVFGEAIRPSTMTARNFSVAKDSDSSNVAGALVISNANKTVTFTPTAALTASAKYLAIVGTGVKDTSGNALAAQKVTDFTVAS